MRFLRFIPVALLSVVLAGCVSPAQDASKTPEQSAESQSESSSSDNTSQAKTTTDGQYISYEDYLEQKDSLGDRIVYYFNASWCPSCKRTNQALLDNVDDIPEATTIVSVDFDKYIDLRKEYGITMQDTFVELDEDGNMKKAFVAPVIDDVWNALSV